MNTDSVDALLAEQKKFYDLRAPDFGNAAKSDRIGTSSLAANILPSVVAEFDPRGDVLELACGTGWLTRELARYADSVTAVDASTAMIARAQHEVGADAVRFVHADIFEWSPDREYDVVWFANWLSHVPPTRFDDFWALVERCLAPNGRVGFIDEDERAVHNDDRLSVGDVPAARRTLSDGSVYRVVKVFRSPDELASRLHALAWHAEIQRLGESFLSGVARPMVR